MIEKVSLALTYASIILAPTFIAFIWLGSPASLLRLLESHERPRRITAPGPP